MAGIQMVGLKRARGETIQASTAFHYWHRWFTLGCSGLLHTIAIAVPLLLFGYLWAHFAPKISLSALPLSLIVIGCMLVLLLQFYLLAVVDKKKGAFGALIYSAKIVLPHWFKVLMMSLFTLLLFVVTALPGELALILYPHTPVAILSGMVISLLLFVWILPYTTLLKANIFHHLSD